MSGWLKTLFVSIFGTHSGIATFIISMIPIVELRGAIPFGAASALWGENALALWQSFLISLGGSSLICVALTFLFFPFFNWLKRTKAFAKFAAWIERKLKRKSKKIEEKTEVWQNKKHVLWAKLFGIFCFVAVPLPLTGVWMGTCLALFIGLNRKQTLATVLLGNAVAGSLMTLVSYFFANNTLVVLYAFLIVFAVIVLIEIVRIIYKKIKNRAKEVSEAPAENSRAEDK